MSKTVVLPNALEISFPDNATDAEMSSSLAQYLLTGAPAQQVEAEEAVEVERPEATGKFFKSIGRGIDQMQGAIGSGIDVIGEATGIEAIEKFGERQAARNEVQLLEKEVTDPRLQLRDVENIMVGKQSWVDYIQQSLGEVLPSMGFSLAGAGAGAATGAALGLGIGSIPASLVGGALGAFLPSALMGAGEVQQTIKELDPNAESPWAALGGGAIIGALDVAALSVPVLKSIGKGIPKDSIIKGLISNGVSEKVAKGAVGTAYKSISKAVKQNFPAGRVGKGLSLGIQSAGAEGLTERLQELTSIEIGEAVTDKEVMNRAERLLEATVMGVIAGAGFGGGAGVITGKNYDPADTLLPEIERGADDEIILSGIDPEDYKWGGLEETLIDDADADSSGQTFNFIPNENQRSITGRTYVSNDEQIALMEVGNDGYSDKILYGIVGYVNGVPENIGKLTLKQNEDGRVKGIQDLINIELKENVRGKGIGEKIVNGLLNYSIKPEGLSIRDINPNALPFWEKLNLTLYDGSQGKEKIKSRQNNILGFIPRRQEEIAPVEPEQIKWNTPIMVEGYPDLDEPYIFEQDKLDKEQLDRIRTDQQRLKTAINKAPALFMDTLIYGDPNFSTINKPQTIKSFGDKFSVKSIEERVAIFDALIENGRIELVGKNKWKYSDKSLNNKQYKAVSNKAKKNTIIFEKPQSQSTSKTSYRTTIPAEVNGKKIIIIEEVKQLGPEEGTVVRYDIRGQGSKGGRKLIYKDKDFRRFRTTTAKDVTEARAQELSLFNTEIFNFMNQEHIGLFAEQSLRADKRYPVGTSVEESFQILLLGKDLKNKNDKPYKNYKDLIDDIALREKDVENLIQDKALKQKERKERRRLRNPGIDRLIEAEIADIDNNIANTKQEIVDRKLVIKGFDSTNTIAQPATLKEIERTLTARERQARILQIRRTANQRKIAGSFDADGTKKPGKAERDSKHIVNPVDEDSPISEEVKAGTSLINFWSEWVQSGAQIASKFIDYRPFHKVAKTYDQLFRGMTAIATQLAGPYAQLNTRGNSDKKYNVHRALYAGMLVNTKPVPSPDGKTYTITIPKYYSYENYGVVRDADGNIIEDDDAITEFIENGGIIKDGDGNAIVDTEAYFQQAVDAAVGGKRRNAKMYNFKAGEPVTLTDPLEIDGIDSLYLALDTMYDRVIQATVNQAGTYSVGGKRVFIGEKKWWDSLQERVDGIVKNADGTITEINRPPNLNGDPVTSVAELLKAEAAKEQGEKLKAYLEDIADAVANLESMRNQGYFPSVREGNGHVRIFRYELNKDGKLQRKTAHREEIVESFGDRIRFGGDFQRTGKKYVSKHLADWREDHPEAKKNSAGNYIPEEGMHGIEFSRNDNIIENEYAMDINMPGLERILLTYDQVYNVSDRGGITKNDPNEIKFNEGVDEFQTRIRNIFSQARRNKNNRSFKSHTNRRRGIPGFVTPENMDTYWSQAFGLYTAKVGRYVARLETENDMRTELEKLKNLTVSDPSKPLFGSTLFQVAKEQAEFLYSPQSAASFFKSIAFNGFLGGNISSLMVNLSQLNVAASFLFGAYGLKGRGAMLRGAKDATILVSDIMFAPASFIFFPLAPKGKAKSDWTASEKAGEEQYKKWNKAGAIESREIFEVLVESQRRGSFGKINTEAIAQNADVTLNFIRQKVGINPTIANPIGSVSNFLTTMYASGEMINRIATTLAAARLVKKFGAGEMRNFAEGIPGQNMLLDAEINKNNPSEASFQEMVAAGETASNATQFNLDPYNRPKFSRYFGGIPMQFLGFVTLMIEVYSNALFGNYGKKELNFINDAQKRRMLVALVGQQIMLGGLFALPFADDMDDIVRLISKKIPEMPETSIYEILYETLIDNAGLTPDVATSILRGPLEGVGPISVGKRIALSPFQNILNMRSDNILQVPFKLMGGPSASFIEGWTTRIGGAAKEGRWDKVALYLPPTALTTNIANAYYNSMEGMRTGSGRQLNDGLSGLDSLWALIGFTPTTVSRTREEIARTKYMNGRMSSVRDKYVDVITRLQLAARRETDPIKRQAYRDRVSKLINEVYKRDAGKEMEDKIDPTYSMIPSVGSRMKQALDPVTPGAITQPRQIMLPRMLELMGRERPS